jgi:hypothetical protein
MATNYNPSIVTSGLVLCLDAGNTKSYPGSGTTWTDLSGNSNGGTLVNSPTYSNTNGGILTFNGTNQYGSTPLSLGGYTAFTLSAWVNTTVSEREIMATYGITNIFEFWIGSNKLSCYARGATLAYRVSNISITTGSWFYCVGVYQGSNGTLNTYINGFLDNGALGGTVPAALNSGTSTAVIGNLNVGSYYFNGSMGPVKIYNIALTADQVLQNYNALRGRFGL